MKAMILLSGLTVSLAACQNSGRPPIQAVEEPADSADQVISDFQTEAVSDLSGIRLSLVRGDSAWFYQNTQHYLIRNITVIFPDSNGKTISTITARTGVYDASSQSLDARDSVVGMTPDGRILRTEHLIWDPRSNDISSDTSFTLTSPGEPPLIRGSSFVATPDFQNIRINEASGRLNRPKPAAPQSKGNPATKPGNKATTSSDSGGRASPPDSNPARDGSSG